MNRAANYQEARDWFWITCLLWGFETAISTCLTIAAFFLKNFMNPNMPPYPLPYLADWFLLNRQTIHHSSRRLDHHLHHWYQTSSFHVYPQSYLLIHHLLYWFNCSSFRELNIDDWFHASLSSQWNVSHCLISTWSNNHHPVSFDLKGCRLS